MCCARQPATALETVEIAAAERPEDAAFIKAYCFYRLNRLAEARDALSASDHGDVSYQHIQAQVHYRENEFQESVALLERIVADDEEAATPELLTNMAAALAREGGLAALQHPLLKLEDNPDSYELAYNVAWSHVTSGNWFDAEMLLKRARETCIRTLTEEGFNPGAVANEVAVVRVQLGYVLQKQLKFEEAKAEYETVLRQRPSDDSVAAAASNNLVSLRGNSELFDSFKRNRQVLAESLQRKLTPDQKRTFAFNRGTLLLYMRRLADARAAVADLQSRFPDEATPWLIEAALLREEGNAEECESCLRAFIKDREGRDGADAATAVVQGQLALAQFLAESNRPGEAADVVRRVVDVGTSLGGTATAVALYRRAGRDEDAAACLADSVKAWEARASSGDAQQREKAASVHFQLRRAAANFMIERGLYKEADAALAALLDDPAASAEDKLVVEALRVAATARFDVSQAEEMAAKLPALRSVPVEALEAATVLERRSSTSAAPSSTSGAAAARARHTRAAAAAGGAGGAAASAGAAGVAEGAAGDAEKATELEVAQAAATAAASGRSQKRANRPELTPEQEVARLKRLEARKKRRRDKRRQAHVEKLVAEGRVKDVETALLYKPSADRWQNRFVKARARRGVYSGGAQGSGEASSRDTDRLDIAARKKKEEERRAAAAEKAAAEKAAAAAKKGGRGKRGKKGKKGRR